MSFDFSKIAELSTARGKLVELKNSAGRVIWAVQSAEVITGTLILRPSADISVGHALYPANSVNAYSLINEEVSDGDSTYIYTKNMSNTSKFRLSGEPQHNIKKVTSITLKGEPYNENSSNAGSNTFRLYVDGTLVYSSEHNTDKTIDSAFSGALQINEYLAENGELPIIDLEIASTVYSNTSGSKTYNSGVSQVYVVLEYEA